MTNNKTLSTSAKLAFIGLSYIYIVKLIDTFWHGIFANPAVAFLIVGLNFSAGIAQFIFFYRLKYSTSGNGVLFAIAGWSGVAGSLINILPKLLALSALLQFYFSFNLIKNSSLIAVISPWVGSFLLLGCCSVFLLLSIKNRDTKTRAFLVGAIGYLVLTVIFSMPVQNFLSGSQVKWYEGEIGMSSTYFIVSASFSFLCIAYFYASFFRINQTIDTKRASYFKT